MSDYDYDLYLIPLVSRRIINSVVIFLPCGVEADHIVYEYPNT